MTNNLSKFICATLITITHHNSLLKISCVVAALDLVFNLAAQKVNLILLGIVKC